VSLLYGKLVKFVTFVFIWVLRHTKVMSFHIVRSTKWWEILFYMFHLLTIQSCQKEPLATIQFLSFFHIWQQEAALNAIVNISKYWIIMFWCSMHLQVSRHFICVTCIKRSIYKIKKIIVLCHFTMNNAIGFNAIVITR